MDKLITTIEKNAREEIQVSLSNFKGHDLLGIRVFAETDNGDKVPTKKGITCNVKLIPGLLSALKEAEQIAIAEGLIHEEKT